MRYAGIDEPFNTHGVVSKSQTLIPLKPVHDYNFVPVQPICRIESSLDFILKLVHDVVLNNVFKRRAFQRLVRCTLDFLYGLVLESLVCIAGSAVASYILCQTFSPNIRKTSYQ